MNANGMIDLDLSTLGELNAEVSSLIPALVKSLADEKSKAKVTITIDFKRMKDSESAVIVAYAVKPVFPKKAQNVLCRTDLCGNLSTEPQIMKQPNLPFVQTAVKEEA